MKSMYHYPVLFALGFLFYFPVLGFWFTDVDALSLIQTGRFSSLSEFLGLFTQELLGGRMPNATYYRPFLSLTYGVLWVLFRLEPMGYHIVQISLHCLNACLVFWMGKHFFPKCKPTLVFIIAIFFLLHPLHVENVPATARLGDILAAFWILLTLALTLMFQKYPTKHFFFWGSFLTSALAIGTKEPAIIVLPLIFLLYFDTSNQNSFLQKTRNALVACWPMVVLGLGFLTLRMWILRGTGGYVPVDDSRGFVQEFFFRWQYVLMGHVFGLGLGGFPGHIYQTLIQFMKHHGWPYVLFWIFLTALSVIYLRNRWQDRRFRFFIAFVFLQMVMIYFSFFMFRYLYLTLIPFSWLILWEWNHFRESGGWQSKRYRVAFFATLFWVGNLAWANPGTQDALYYRWQESGEIAKTFLQSLERDVRENPQWENVYMIGVPFKRLYRPQNYFFWDMPQTQILLEHAVQDYMHLVFANRKIGMHGLAYVFLWQDPDEYVLQTRIRSPQQIFLESNAEIIDYPWEKIPGRVTSNDLYDLDIEPGGKSAFLSISPKIQSDASAAILVYAHSKTFEPL